jgi:2-polyprenyl-3-methyl-5-hydroxy-6-metoxy-1,4-benzoquinol methylase
MPPPPTTPTTNSATTDTATRDYYNAFPYDSFVFAQTHPSRLGAIARVFGAQGVVPIDKARVLEVGCASGGNLMAMAAHYPDARFLGIDFAERQIEQGRDLLRQFPLPNLQLRAADILDLDESWGRDPDGGPGGFDYILAHGVYSWVPGEVQRHLLAASAKLLAPAGLMYVSYNVNPGWRMRGTIRDLMRYYTDRFEGPMERVRQARALVDFLADALRGQTRDAFITLLQDESVRLKDLPDYYILHEYLEPCNEPLYFHEFADRARQAGLKYLGDSRPATMAAAEFGPEIEKGLRSISRDMIELEQFQDLLRSRIFRESILCRPELSLDHAVTPDRLEGLHLSAPLAPLHSKLDLTEGVQADWKSVDDREIGAREPLAKALLHVLSQVAPASLPYAELVERAAAALNTSPTDDLRKRAGQILLTLFFGSTEVLEVLLSPLPLVSRPGPRPAVCPLARFQARTGYVQGDEVCSRRHRMVKLDPAYRALLPHIDGRPREEIPATDDDLRNFARHGLLVS